MLMLSTPGQNNYKFFSVNKVQACAHLLRELLVTIVYGRTDLHVTLAMGKVLQVVYQSCYWKLYFENGEFNFSSSLLELSPFEFPISPGQKR